MSYARIPLTTRRTATPDKAADALRVDCGKIAAMPAPADVVPVLEHRRALDSTERRDDVLGEQAE
jgi:hypothetical protein